MSQVISIKKVREQKEKQRWNEILSDLEKQIKLKADDGLNTPEEEKGFKNFTNLVKKLRERHCGEDNDDQEVQ
jgi:uncharacterized UPF0160 family protein